MLRHRCDVTMEEITAEGPRRPHLLPCGHTLSQEGLQQVCASARGLWADGLLRDCR